MPPANPNSPTVNDADRDKYRSGYQKAPKLFIEARVEMLAPTGERQQRDEHSNKVYHVCPPQKFGPIVPQPHGESKPKRSEAPERGWILANQVDLYYFWPGGTAPAARSGND
jgi:hypothetical protein